MLLLRIGNVTIGYRVSSWQKTDELQELLELVFATKNNSVFNQSQRGPFKQGG